MRAAIVTGSTSYLGRALCRDLISSGVDVHALVRPTTDLADFEMWSVRPTFHVHDGGTEKISALVAQASADIVFHLATHYEREHKPNQIERMVASNVLFGTQLLDAMRRAGIRRMVVAGTFFQFAIDGTYSPLNLYAATKQAFEDILAYYARAARIESAVLVLSDVYGPGDRRTKLMAAIRDAQRTGTPLPLPDEDQELDVVYVDDAVAAFVRAAELLEARPTEVTGRRFSVTSGTRHRLSDIVAAFEAVAGTPVKRAWGAFETPQRSVNTPWKGATLPGLQAEISLHEGVRRFLAG